VEIELLPSSPVISAAEHVEGLFSAVPVDIVAAVKEVHEGLRNYLKVLKDAKKNMKQSHCFSEEEAVYVPSRELVGHEALLVITEWSLQNLAELC
jgi:hypothetical protein